MTAHRRSIRPRAGGAATGLFLGGLLVAATASFAVPAKAQTVESRRDQPNASTLPSDFPTLKGDKGRTDGRTEARAEDRTGGVAPPSAIRATTAIVPSADRRKASVTNPLDHLPPQDRAGLKGRRE
ncbi:hypothetical protein U8607_09100 [Methylobacterium durans]|uniref:Uncharacterized protein n=1 Tax=Methylobacterium durans TaxID=2202825 RepID=A0A2U8W7U9_9HYPH|nr:hypothetical protein [Methylobacterium durans]AWN41668.1 hypothetical protein DK389_15580 [Methylobacterium durans]MEA1832239.1 hypothetical protein [Methylobacterium durans]